MKVISNTAISLDGKISLYHEKYIAIGSVYDRKQMRKLRGRADAILIGGQTFRNGPVPSTSGLKSKKIINCVVSHSEGLNPSILFKKKQVPLFLFSDNPQAKSIKGFDKIFFKKKITPAFICKQLSLLGVKTLLIEGGGKLIHSFLKAGLLDEMYVTVCPKLIGLSTAPSLVDGNGFGKMKRLSLINSKKVGGEFFLHYKVLRSSQ